MCLLAAPFLLLTLVEAICFPLETFPFRSWESLSVRKLKWAFPGPFYPNRHLSRTEVGDLGNGTAYAVPHSVEWFTDDYGFRNRQTRDANELDLVIIGDSFVAGTGLTQDDQLSEVIERQYGYHTASYAPANLKHFSRDPRFASKLPSVVIFAAVERTLPGIAEPGRSKAGFQQQVTRLGTDYESLMCALDRLVAPQMFYYLQARLRPEPRRLIIASDQPQLLFLSDHQRESAATADVQSRVLEKIRRYHAWVKERGSRFVFVPIPDKEYCHAESLPLRTWPSILPELVANLRSDGIEVVDLAPLFRQTIARDPSDPLYQLDDSHWNAHAVRLAAEQIANRLERPASLRNPIRQARHDVLEQPAR
jgi:hypothetical protein